MGDCVKGGLLGGEGFPGLRMGPRLETVRVSAPTEAFPVRSQGVLWYSRPIGFCYTSVANQQGG